MRVFETVTSFGNEVDLPGSGLLTVISCVPISPAAAVPATVICVAVTFETVNAVPLYKAVVVGMNPVPCSVRLKAPGLMRAGITVLMTGIGLVSVMRTVRVMLFFAAGSGETSRIAFTVTGFTGGAKAGAMKRPVLPMVPIVALPPFTSFTYQTIDGLVMFSVVTVN